MPRFIRGCLVLFLGLFSAAAHGETLAVFHRGPQSDFAQRILPALQEELRSCDKCQVVNLTQYSASGEALPMSGAEWKSRWEKSQAKVMLFPFNELASESNADFGRAVQAVAKDGALVVASAGLARPGETMTKLDRTLFGQMPDVMIIGDLGARERMHPSAFFGPQLLTALHLPRFTPTTETSRMPTANSATATSGKIDSAPPRLMLSEELRAAVREPSSRPDVDLTPSSPGASLPIQGSRLDRTPNIATGVGAAVFAARLVRKLPKRDDWPKHLRETRFGVRKIWPDLTDLFGR